MAFANVLLVAGSANFSTRDVWDGYRLSLEMHGLQVVPYPTFSFLKLLSADAVANDLIGAALDVSRRFDAVVFVDGLYFRGERARVPQSIRRAGIPTVLIATDDPYDTIPNVESLYTYRFTNEIRCAVDGAIYLPTATLPLPPAPEIVQPRYDVSFLGTVFEDRLPLLLEVAKYCEREQRRMLVAGKIVAGQEDLQTFGLTEVRSRTIESIEKWEIYSQSRLTINLFRQSDPSGDSPGPRNFEVTAFGKAALLSGPRRFEVTRIWGDSVYHFDDAAGCIDAIRLALADDAGRLQRVQRAREKTLKSHLYEHRAADLIAHVSAGEQAATAGVPEERIGWIIGSGRTGSTWLAEMLGDLPRVRKWHEPYFGRFLKHLHDRPDERERHSSFFAKRHESIWIDGLRRMFFEMVQDRYPRFGRHGLVVKEVNTPEAYRWLRAMFPTSKLIWLVRDPFDILDSYLDLQKPGSWNPRFGDSSAPLAIDNVRRTAEHIRDATLQALAAYDAAPIERRLRITYEELLLNPQPALLACCQLIGVETEAESLAAVVEKHRFDKHKSTGTLQFRRKGRAGVWRESPNFSPEVRAIADEMLGPLRGRLGYVDVESTADS
ncbi:MAG: sulfotransferase [Planctomycetaceae bacterium]